MAALDELLGIINKDEINVGLGRDSCEGFIKENETLYESAIADQTWMALEESTNNENNHISGKLGVVCCFYVSIVFQVYT